MRGQDRCTHIVAFHFLLLPCLSLSSRGLFPWKSRDGGNFFLVQALVLSRVCQGVTRKWRTSFKPGWEWTPGEGHFPLLAGRCIGRDQTPGCRRRRRRTNVLRGGAEDVEPCAEVGRRHYLMQMSPSWGSRAKLSATRGECRGQESACSSPSCGISFDVEGSDFPAGETKGCS